MLFLHILCFLQNNSRVWCKVNISVNYNYYCNILHDIDDAISIPSSQNDVFQGNIVIDSRSGTIGVESWVLRETIVICHASTFAFNCVCKSTLGQVNPTRHFDGRTNDVKDSSRIYDVTSALHVQEETLTSRR